MKRFFKIAGLMLCGAVVAGGGIAIAVAIGGAINHITFGEQITQWFGFIGKQAIETGKDIVAAMI